MVSDLKLIREYLEADRAGPLRAAVQDFQSLLAEFSAQSTEENATGLFASASMMEANLKGLSFADRSIGTFAQEVKTLIRSGINTLTEKYQSNPQQSVSETLAILRKIDKMALLNSGTSRPGII